MFILRKLYCRTFQTAFRIALPVLPYRNPKVVDSTTKIPSILRKRHVDSVMIVTDAGVHGLGLIEPLKRALTKCDITYCVYDRTVPNPTIENVEEARKMYLKHDAQALIAFGGGSAMDCAKACGARIARPKKSLNEMGGILKVMRPIPLLIAVPTTAGMGSETTLAAVIKDPATNHKYAINDFPLIPRYAVLDYRVTMGLPKSITATTGMDALTHAVEAYIGRSTTAETRALAEEAVRLISQYLKRAYDDGSDREAREGMLRAAFCAGEAFSKSYVGYIHAVAHAVGGRYGTPHGLANAVILPIVLRMYGEACEAKLAKLAKIAGVARDCNTDEEAAELFISWIEEMNASMDIPDHLEEIREEDIPAMARYADKEGNPLYPVPVLMDREELEEIFFAVKGEE
ncbi:MAG: iron-containing alcohol dehydrogenase [Lachnospiraceae bacterium]|nr:iron-containing alcohol dehydrogenase [Lachnospiraceae bacterium]